MSEKADLASLYHNLRPIYEKYATELAHLIGLAIERSGIRYHDVSCRAKDLGSLINKVSRPEKSYSDPLRDITDLAGVRVVVHRMDDVYRVLSICHEILDVREDDSREPYASDAFGYESAHIIVTPGRHRSHLPEWVEFMGRSAEIQVRTLLQHAWAETAHAYQYKREGDVPIALRRRLSRIAALLEVADSEFTSVVQGHEALDRALRAEANGAAGTWDAPVDAASLQVLLETHPLVSIISQESQRSGFTIGRSGFLFSLSKLDVLCRQYGLTSINSLRMVLQQTQPNRQEYFNDLYHEARHQFKFDSWETDDAFNVALVLMLALGDELALSDYDEDGRGDFENAEMILNVARRHRPKPT